MAAGMVSEKHRLGDCTPLSGWPLLCLSRPSWLPPASVRCVLGCESWFPCQELLLLGMLSSMDVRQQWTAPAGSAILSP